MNDFGSLLKQYRRKSADPQRGGALTQERLGELLGEELGGAGYTGGAVSEWERNKSNIAKDQRIVLVALIRILHRNNGIANRTEADQFLLAGNYRPLDDREAGQIFLMHNPPENSANVTWVHLSKWACPSLIPPAPLLSPKSGERRGVNPEI